MITNTKEEWNKYCTQTLALLSPELKNLGYTLYEKQPHIIGERFLTRPIAGGRKLVLIGKNIKSGRKVIIKVSNEPLGIEELEHERNCRTVLHNIKFAYQVFHLPKELLFKKPDITSGFAIAITEFIEQDQSFITRTIKEQFALILKALKAQEEAHATTYEHIKLVRETFGKMHASDYNEKVQIYSQDIIGLVPQVNTSYKKLNLLTEKSIAFLYQHQEILDQYGGFLTHWDFTPQNFRVNDGEIYMLDNSSLRFGNKYEGWARFINFMTLYNPPLADALVEYVRINRTPEEFLSLKLMRIYRFVELIRYYTAWLSSTNGDLRILTEARIAFWTKGLECVLDDTVMPIEIINQYKHIRDTLRSEDERQRQKGLH